MKALLLLVLTLAASFGQAPPSKIKENLLVAAPAKDLFDFATLIYNTASEEKDQKKKQGGYQQAAKKFDSFLRNYPSDPKTLEAYYFLGICYRNIGQLQASQQCFETVVNTWKKGKYVEASALYLASDFYAAEQWLSAAEWFKVVARQTSDKKIRQESLYRRFLCFNKLQDNESIVSSLQEILEDQESPFKETSRLALARVYQRTKNTQGAHEQYALLSQADKKEIRAEAILQAAITANDLQNPQLAKEWFSAALKEPELANQRAQTQLALMNLHYQAKEWIQLIEVFRLGDFELDQANEEQRLIMAAKAFEETNREKEALTIYQRLSLLNPGSTYSYQASYRLLIRHHKDEHLDFAKSAETFLSTYQKEHHQDPKYQSARLLLAEHYYTSNHHDKAIENYRLLDLKKIDPSNHLGIRYHVAKCQLALKDSGGSLGAIDVFLKQYPKTKQATQLRLDRAELLSSIGRDQEAMIDYDLVLKQSTDPELRRVLFLRLADLYQKNQDWEAFASIQKKILLLPNADKTTLASAHFWLGWDHYRLKREKEALDHLIKARELDPQSLSEKVGPLLIRAAYKSENMVLLETEINTLRKANPSAQIPSSILTWLGASLAKENHHNRAWPFFNEGLNDQSKIVVIPNSIWMLYGKSSIQTTHYREALNAAIKILETEQNPYRKAEAFFLQSQSLMMLEQFDNARQATSKGLDLRPKGELDIQLRIHAGDIDMAENKPEKALRHYAVVEALYAKSADEKKAIREKLTAALKAIGTPEALEKLKAYQ